MEGGWGTAAGQVRAFFSLSRPSQRAASESGRRSGTAKTRNGPVSPNRPRLLLRSQTSWEARQFPVDPEGRYVYKEPSGGQKHQRKGVARWHGVVDNSRPPRC